MTDLNVSKLRIQRQDPGGPRARAPRSRRSWLIAVAAIVALGLWWVYPTTVDVQLTQAVTAWPSQQYLLLNATGYVTARRKAVVASKGTGRVQWIGVSEGDFVKAGTVVARLDNRDVEASYQAAAANVAVARAAVESAQITLDDSKKNLDRTVVLFKKQLVSLFNLEDARSAFSRALASTASAKAQLQAAQANEEFAHINVENTEVRAPFDGVVISRSANVGDIETPLSSAADARGGILVMADMTSLEVDADVSEGSLSSIKTGQPCDIVLDAFPDRHFAGVVNVIVPAVNRSSDTVTVRVRLIDQDSRILPDMSARVSFLSRAVPERNEKPLLAVTPAAIVQRDGHSVVYRVADDAVAHAVPVTTGPMLGAVREIMGALKAGDVLVLNPADRVTDGAHVSLAKSK